MARTPRSNLETPTPMAYYGWAMGDDDCIMMMGWGDA